MSQNDMLLEYLKSGKGITQMEAIGKFGIGRLASRICDLKARGYDIVAMSKAVTKTNGKKTIVCEYFMRGET